MQRKNPYSGHIFQDVVLKISTRAYRYYVKKAEEEGISIQACMAQVLEKEAEYSRKQEK